MLIAMSAMGVALWILWSCFGALAERTASLVLGWKLLIWLVPGAIAVTALSLLIDRIFNVAALLVRQRATLLRAVSTIWLVVCCLWLSGYLLGPFAYGWAFLPNAWLSTTIFSVYLLWLALVDYCALQLESDSMTEATARPQGS